MFKELNDVFAHMGTWGPHLLLLLKVILIILAAFVVERMIFSLLRGAYTRARNKGHDEVTRYRFLRNAVRSAVAVSMTGGL